MVEHSDSYCLFLGSTGIKNSEEREMAAKLFTSVSYFAKRKGLVTIHGDQLAAKGKINDRLIRHIFEDKIVVADLFGSPSHVFYMLGLRHSTAKPAIHIIRPEQKLPFDYSTMNPLVFSLKDDNAYIDFRRSLEGQLSVAIDNPQYKSSPVTVPMHLLALKKLGIPQAAELADFLYNNANVHDKFKAIQHLLESIEKVPDDTNQLDLSEANNGAATRSGFEKTLIQINVEKRILKDKLKKCIESDIFPLVIKMELASEDDRKYYREMLVNSLKWFYTSLNYTDLTPDEVQICELIADGLSPKEIARQQNRNYYSVLICEQRILKKLNLPFTRAELKKYLRQIL